MKVVIANSSPYKNRFVEVDQKGNGKKELVCIPPKGVLPRSGGTVTITDADKKNIEKDQYLKIRIVEPDKKLEDKKTENNSKAQKKPEDSKK